MKIAIGCDHIVTDIKNKIIDYLKQQGIEVVDCGTYDFTRTHYPIYGRKVALKVVNQEVDYGIVLCGTGIGISNAAQKVKGARCALVSNIAQAIEARENWNCNIIGFGGRVTGMGMIEECIDAFLHTEYQGKNKALIEKINACIQNENQDEHLFDEFLEKWERGEYQDALK